METRHLIAYYIGIAIIFGSHLYLLYVDNQNLSQPPMSMKPHSYLNLVAGGLIAYYFMNREGIIDI